MPRCHVTLKLATSLDGRIATAGGESRWITGEAARVEAHRLRAAHDAILVGIGTALADDPALTVRLPEGEAAQRARPPLRVVLDTRLRLPTGSRLVRTLDQGPVLAIGGEGVADGSALRAAGVEVGHVARAGARLDIRAAVELLAGRGVRRLFVEGGGEIAAAFIKADLADAIEWFRAPILLGAAGLPALGALASARLSDAPRLKRVAVCEIGPDLWERYRREE